MTPNQNNTLDNTKNPNIAKLDTLDNIFSYLYLSTNWESWLSYTSWEELNWTNFSVASNNKGLANIHIPVPWQDNITISNWYTWKVEELKKLLKWKHVKLISENISREWADSLIDLNITWKGRDIVIVTNNLHTDTYNVFIVTPNWEKLSIPWRTISWVEKEVKDSVWKAL